MGRSLAGGSLPRVVVGAHPTRLPGEWGRGQPPTLNAKREKPLVRVSILTVASSPVAPIVYPLILVIASRDSILTREVTSLFLFVYSFCVPLSPSLSISVFLAGSPGERSRSVPPEGDIPDRS